MTNAEKENLADRLIKKLESIGYVVSFRKTTNVKHGLKKIRWSVSVWKLLTSKRTNDIKVQMMYVDAKHWTPKQGLAKRNMLDDMLRTTKNKQAFVKPNSFFPPSIAEFRTFLMNYFSSYEELDMRLSIDGF